MCYLNHVQRHTFEFDGWSRAGVYNYPTVAELHAVAQSLISLGTMLVLKLFYSEYFVALAPGLCDSSWILFVSHDQASDTLKETSCAIVSAWNVIAVIRRHTCVLVRQQIDIQKIYNEVTAQILIVSFDTRLVAFDIYIAALIPHGHLVCNVSGQCWYVINDNGFFKGKSGVAHELKSFKTSRWYVMHVHWMCTHA